MSRIQLDPKLNCLEITKFGRCLVGIVFGQLPLNAINQEIIHPQVFCDRCHSRCISSIGYGDVASPFAALVELRAPNVSFPPFSIAHVMVFAWTIMVPSHS